MIAMQRLHILLFCLLPTLLWSATDWRVQNNGSTLSFAATQAGARFEGRFEKFTAQIRFDPQDLAASRFDVAIDTGSVNSQDGERDDVIRGVDLFAVKQFPQARYVAERFTAQGGNRFRAHGKLTLRNVTRDVPADFTFERTGEQALLKGAARINRLDFGVGQGEWQSTEWVGADVEVRFALRLTP